MTGGIGWKKISDKIPDLNVKTNFGRQLVNWLLGIVVVYSFLFGIGQIIFLEYLYGTLILAVGILSAAVIYKNLKKENHA